MMKNFGWIKTGFILLFAVGLSVLTVLDASATHLRAGQIKVKRIGGAGSRRCSITVTVYTDTNCSDCILFGGTLDVLDFGDNTSMLVPTTPNKALVPPVPGVGVASFTVEHTYGSNGRYTISYLEPNRNDGVLNMDNSVETTFYIETQIDLSVNGQSNSPELKIPPIDVGCVGVAFFHNPGAVDIDGDSLSYELVQPFRDRNTSVLNYRHPNNQAFYAGNYNTANEAGTGPPTFAIDAISGTLTWDAPGKKGEYNIAFVVKEWRKIEGVWTNIGFVRRDMQIIIDECNNERPTLEIPEDACVVAGTVLNETIKGFDVDGSEVKIEAFSEILESTFPSRATATPQTFQPLNPEAELVFNWNTTCEHVKDQAYQVVFKITDKPATGPALVTFGTWRIKVVAPAPILQTATVILPQQNVKLDWTAYECFENANKMQIWRRVSATDFVPDSCQTGMPESWGFTLIATIPMVDGLGNPVTTYTDLNVEANAQYCYRLVAIFPQPRGGESYVSVEKCIDPILTSEPVITKVSVEKTSELDGEIRVEWRQPLDESSYPPPYRYQLQQNSGAGFTSISPIITDTVYTVPDLNTYDEIYSYRVLLYSDPISLTVPVDMSSVAGSVWLDLNPRKGKITLNWSADVPWSNQIEDYPMHQIFRGFEGDDESSLVLIDSVNVLEEGLMYEDDGSKGGLPGDSLNSKITYCYRVKTRGGYGNPKIVEPLVNFSQINCAVPNDSLPPCKPVIAAFVNTCRDFDYGCEATLFKNTVRWSPVCDDDIRGYNVYFSTIKNGSYQLDTVNVRDTFFIDSRLPSLAYCYRVTAVDRSGNESPMSDPVCNDNCPYYELPNVFSPNGDGCNDLFRAFGDDLNVGETSNSTCTPVDIDQNRCARFVQRVDFTVYNRWGRKVFSYVGQQGDENSIYIRWDGKDDNGRELGVGVYYYAAEVTFDVINSADRVKVVKGWVQLIR